MTNILLYAATVLIWGASWIGVRFQVAEASPAHGVLYRFALAAFLTLAALAAIRRLAPMTGRQHLLCLGMGLAMFAVNYLLVYTAIGLGLTTGLAALVYSLLIVMNAANARLFFGEAPGPGAVPAAALGLAGMGFLFAEDLMAFTGAGAGLGALLCIGGVYGASLGNMISRRLQAEKVDVLTANGWAMAYGAAALLLWSLATDRNFAVPTSAPFLVSLVLLAVFSTIAAFWTYLTLLGRIGAARAAYAFVAFPAVALAISSIWEGYVWTTPHLIGVALIVAGNLALLRGLQKR